MRLSRLTLHGFKTFADRTEVTVGPGLTAIVGPNGSGKSNLVDAIRWAVGEATARDLRGTRAEQVIFAGGAGRAPVGMAEVVITLDDPEGRLPVEGGELAIGRRVYRDGVSEFRQNGRRVRLRDLEHLLRTTGLTESGYAVVAQHDIDAVVQGSPGHRRQLIEVAAGVRMHQAVLQEVGAALAATTAAMEGAGGRLAEVEPRLAALEDEARAAAEAERVQERLRRLRGSLEREAWLRATGEVQRLRRRRDAAAARLAEAEAAARAFVPAYESGVRAVERAQAARPAAERRLGETRVEVERALAQVERWEDRCIQLVRPRDRALRAAAAAAADRLSALALGDQRAREAPLAEQERSRARVASATAALAVLVARADELERRRRAAAEAAEAAATRAARSAATAAAAATAESAAAAACDAGRAALDQARAAIERAAAALPAAAAEQQEGALVLGRADAGLAVAEAAERASLEALEAAEATRRRAVAEEQAADGERAASAARLAAQDRGPIARAARAGTLPLQPLLERVRPLDAADAVAVEAGLAEVAAALFGTHRAVMEAAAMAGDPAELLCWEADSPAAVPEPPAPCRRLVQAIQPDRAVTGIVAGLAAGVVLAPDEAAAGAWLRLHPQGRAVLPDGAVLGAGLRRTPARQPGRIEDAGRLAAAEAAAARTAGAVVAAGLGLERAQVAHAEARAEVDRCRARRARAAAGAEAGRLALEAARRTLAAAGGEAESCTAAAGQAESAQRRADQDARVAQEAAAADAAAADAAAAELAAAERAGVAGTARLPAAREDAQAAALAAARAEALLSVAQERAAERARRAAAAEAALEEASATVSSCEVDAARGLAALGEARAAASVAQEAAAAAEAQLRTMAEAGGDPLAELSALEGRRATLASAAIRAQAEVDEVGVELVERVREAERLAPPAGGAGETDGVEPERAAREIGRLERRLEAIGPVNALAAAQRQELLARTAAMRAAHADCAAALADCGELVGGLRGRVDRRFDATFRLVAERFGDHVTELFDGARGGIELLAPPAAEGDGPVSPLAPPPGVMLAVAPRGKRQTPLALLSGGERALTALAFILALQAVRPSPFYVFDEVDAALDDHRVGRFVTLLQRLAADTQFVVVTHNHATMERAGVLLGVTLAGDGTSRVLSVELTTAMAQAERGAGDPGPAPAREPVAAGGGARDRDG